MNEKSMGRGSDGRARDALRPVSMRRRFTKYAEGSVLLNASLTSISFGLIAPIVLCPVIVCRIC